MEVKGEALVRDNDNYAITAGQMEIYASEGVTFVVDNEAKEVYIQESAHIDLSQVPGLLGGRRQLKGTYTDPATGQVFRYVLTDIEKRGPEDADGIPAFSVESLPEGWIVTDLR